jgi:hypothetical protein
LNKIETPNAIVSLNDDGFKFEKSIEDVKFNLKKQTKTNEKEINNDETVNMKIIKNPIKQKIQNKRPIQMHQITTKRTTYKSKYNTNNTNMKPKSKPKEYDGKLGFFKSKIPAPYKPIPTNFPTKANADIKTDDIQMETRPSEVSRNKDIENIRGQVQTTVTEGDEVLFKSISSSEE